MSPNYETYESSKSWTDDVPVCKLSAIGFNYNQMYREDGNQQEAHPFEDKSFHYRFSDTAFLYGVFDGHGGSKAADFCSQHMAAELLLGQLTETKSDDDIKELLRQAYVSVEKSYMDSIYDCLAWKTSLQYQIEGLNPYEANKEKQGIIEQIKQIDMALSSGTAIALALIFNNKLFVTNVGNCRVLLCQTDHNGVLKVVQLTTNHDLKNEDELKRLSKLGMNVDKLRKNTSLGNQSNTRCIGNYLLKGGYKEFEDLCCATHEPVIAEPDICGGMELDQSCRFLLIMSSGLCQSVGEATSPDQVNTYIAQTVVEQFRSQTTLNSVAQAVVDHIVRLHHDWYTSAVAARAVSEHMKREDMTLIVRNFNYPLPHSSTEYNNTNTSGYDCTDETCLSQNLSSGTTLVNSTIDNSSATTTSSRGANESYTGIGTDKKVSAYVDFSNFNERFGVAHTRGEINDFDGFL